MLNLWEAGLIADFQEVFACPALDAFFPS